MQQPLSSLLHRRVVPVSDFFWYSSLTKLVASMSMSSTVATPWRKFSSRKGYSSSICSFLSIMVMITGRLMASETLMNSLRSFPRTRLP